MVRAGWVGSRSRRGAWVACVLLACVQSGLLAGRLPGVLAGGERPDGHPLEGLRAPEVSGLVRADVVDVIDGDTVEVLVEGERRRIHLLGVDAPEYRPGQARPPAHGLASTMFLTNLLAGERVWLAQPPEPTDRYGRERAVLYRDPDLLGVNLELLVQGYARLRLPEDVRGFSHTRRFAAGEAHARRVGKGIWGARGHAFADALPDPADDGADPDASPGADPGADPGVGGVEGRVSAPPSDAPERSEPASAERVYVTPHGSRYHRAGCRHLRGGGRAVDPAEVRDSHRACRTCLPDG